MTRSTLGKSRVRESRTLGSVGAKPNGLATRPSPRAEHVATHRRMRQPLAAEGRQNRLRVFAGVRLRQNLKASKDVDFAAVLLWLRV